MKSNLTSLNPSLWVDEYANRLVRYALSRIGDREASKDLVQDTFLSALKNADGFRGEISEQNWLFTILKNKIIDYYRSKSKAIVHDIEKDMNEISSFFDENDGWRDHAKPQKWQVDYSGSVEQKEFYEVMENCKKKLTELQNIIFTMKYLDDRSSDEICKELEITSSNYWVLLHRARLQMRQCLEKNWFSDKKGI